LLAVADPEAMAKQFFDHGVNLFNAGRVEEASGEFERALELNDANAQAHFRLGMCYVNLGQQEKAKQHLTRFVTDEPTDAEADLARNMLKLLK
jgi:Flp pilus assembly protein TadD